MVQQTNTAEEEFDAQFEDGDFQDKPATYTTIASVQQETGSDSVDTSDANFEESFNDHFEAKHSGELIKVPPLQSELLEEDQKFHAPNSPDMVVIEEKSLPPTIAIPESEPDEFAFTMETPQDDEFGDFDGFEGAQPTQEAEQNDLDEFGDFETENEKKAETTDEFESFEDAVVMEETSLDFRSLGFKQQAVVNSLLSDTLSGADIEQNITDMLEMIILPPHMQKPKSASPPQISHHESIPADTLESLFKTQAPHNIEALNKMAKWTDSQIEKYFLRSIGVQKRGRIIKKHSLSTTSKLNTVKHEKEDEHEDSDRKVSFKTPNSPKSIENAELKNLAELVWSREDLPEPVPEPVPIQPALAPKVANPAIIPPRKPLTKQELAKQKELEEEARQKMIIEKQKLEQKKKEDEKREKKEQLRRLEQERKKQQEEERRKREEQEKQRAIQVQTAPPPLQSSGLDDDFEVDFDDFPDEQPAAPVTNVQPVIVPVVMSVKQQVPQVVDNSDFEVEWNEDTTFQPSVLAPTPVKSTNSANELPAQSTNFFDDDGFGDDQVEEFVSTLPDLSFVVSSPTIDKKKPTTPSALPSLDDFLM
jgi:hypothetical protein